MYGGLDHVLHPRPGVVVRPQLYPHHHGLHVGRHTVGPGGDCTCDSTQESGQVRRHHTSTTTAGGCKHLSTSGSVLAHCSSDSLSMSSTVGCVMLNIGIS